MSRNNRKMDGGVQSGREPVNPDLHVAIIDSNLAQNVGLIGVSTTHPWKQGHPHPAARQKGL